MWGDVLSDKITRYVLENINEKGLFLIPWSKEEYCEIYENFPNAKCDEILTNKKFIKFCQVNFLSKNFGPYYVGKETAKYILERYEKNTNGLDVPIFCIKQIEE